MIKFVKDIGITYVTKMLVLHVCQRYWYYMCVKGVGITCVSKILGPPIKGQYHRLTAGIYQRVNTIKGCNYFFMHQHLLTI